MNFELYSSDWTRMDIKFKKLILLTMLVNESEKTTIRVSMKRVVNMEMFASVRI